VIPQKWKTLIPIPIFKKGQKKNPNNYRGITLLSSVSKVLTKILAKEIKRKSARQQEFRHNRSTIDAIYILRQLIEKAIEFNRPLFLCFVDLKQIFDRVRLAPPVPEETGHQGDMQENHRRNKQEQHYKDQNR